MNKFRYFTIFTLCILSLFSSLTLSGCSKDVVEIKFANEDIATFSFDQDEYYVGDTVNFEVAIDEKYSKSSYSVYANDTLISKNADEKYSYTLDDEVVTFEIKDYVLNTYTYTFDSSYGFTLSTLDDTYINHGDSFSFYISTEMYRDTFVVKVNNDVITPNADDEYIVSNVTNDLNIVVEDYELKSYSVLYVCGAGITIIGDYANINSIDHGESIDFDIEILEGYEKDTNFNVSVNGNVITYDNGYSISNITENITITITGVKLKKYNVTFENITGILGVENDIIEYGEDYFFAFAIDDYYTMTDDFDILVNGDSIYIEDTFGYMIENVTSNMVITFVGVELRKHTVTYSGVEGLNISGSEEVNCGEDYTFTYLLKEGYEVTSGFDILVNGNSIYVNGIITYTINDVVEDLSITFVGVKSIDYDVVFENTTGLIVVGNDSVSYGCDYTFNFRLLTNYRYIDGFDVLVNGSSILVDDTYEHTINNVTSDITISFVGVSLVEYNIEYSINIADSCVVDISNTTVAHGSGYTFTITKVEGYDISEIVVKVNDTIVSPNNGVYIIENVIENQYIVVSGIKEEVILPSTFKVSNLPIGIFYDLVVTTLEGEEVQITEDNMSTYEITSEDILTLYIMGADEDNGYIMNYDALSVYSNTGIVTCIEEYFAYEITDFSEDISLTIGGVYKDGVEHIVVFESSGAYRVISSDNKYVYVAGDYAIFDLDILCEYTSVEVYADDVLLSYIQGQGYMVQIKDNSPSEIYIEVIINN